MRKSTSEEVAQQNKKQDQSFKVNKQYYKDCQVSWWQTAILSWLPYSQSS